MLCQGPYVKGSDAYPCGKCLPCLNRRRSVWTHRIMLESLLHSDNAFVTLTYAEDTLPLDLSLDPAHLRNFLKRLRRKLNGKRIRFYAVGEYGDKTDRPHYHAILFGYPACLRGSTIYSKSRTECCSSCDTIRDVWGLGHVLVGGVNISTAKYVCGYISKNMRRTDDHRLRGRWPEFARMSLRPGIGFGALDELTQCWMQYDLGSRESDVPARLGHGKSFKPLGRYLRNKAREMLGVEKKDYRDEEMLALWKVASDATPSGGEPRRLLFKNLLIEAGEQKVRNMEARSKMYKQERSI